MSNYIELSHKLSEMNDREKWVWLKDNQDIGVTVYLDVSETFVTFDECYDCDVIQFDGYIGVSDGVHDLLDVFDIAHEMI